jgi:hypothetical protein
MGTDINVQGRMNAALIVTWELSVRMEFNLALLATSVVGTDKFVITAMIVG